MSFYYYKKIKKLYESTRTDIWRAHRLKDNKNVILKILKKEYPVSEDIISFQNEYDILSYLKNIKGVINAYEYEKYENYWHICLEDFGGASLNKYIDDHKKIGIEDRLKIAIKIADILAQIHHQNIIHKDISPANIVFNPVDDTLKIIDFGISTQLSKQHLLLKNPDVLEGTLPYISPEQTGRMNCDLDYRTDFYSFGATLYELFTGEVPFKSKNPMELVHSHIAKKPIPPNKINENLPSTLSDIIIKLLEKSPEFRYQNALGVKTDLVECLNQWQQSANIQPFPLAQFDFSERFNIPQKLYGREDDIKRLISSFERISFTNANQQLVGRTEVVMIAGFSGIGKSALVKEIYKYLIGKNGYFISGKFDQFKKNIPYSALINALRELTLLILTETEENLSLWKEKLLTALSPNAQIIIDVIPELELIIGPQPEISQVGPTESQNRFIFVFNNFFNTFCTPEHPLVIFIDDMQWIDISTLKLLEQIITEHENKALLLIGAYRDNEVLPTHPLMISLEKIKNSHASIQQINLQPLLFEHLNQMIAESLHDSLKNVVQLTKLVFHKTQGNPFFVKQFLQTLYEENLLYFEPQTFKNKSYWKYDIHRINQLDMTDNVITLMINKLKKLPGSSQYILSLAACIGNRFNLETLSYIYEKTEDETFKTIFPVLTEGYIIPKSSPEIKEDDIQHSQLIIKGSDLGHKNTKNIRH